MIFNRKERREETSLAAWPSRYPSPFGEGGRRPDEVLAINIRYKRTYKSPFLCINFASLRLNPIKIIFLSKTQIWRLP